MIFIGIVGIVALIVGALAGYGVFRYVLKGKYNEMISTAEKDAEVIKEKKPLLTNGLIKDMRTFMERWS
jgi:ribonuclease Y